jgi:membrane protease YdiL (CAAX protease family)
MENLDGLSGPRERLPERRRALVLLLGLFLTHVTIWTGLVYLAPGTDRVSFEYLGDQSTPWIRQFVLPLIAVLVFQLATITHLRWWGPVLRDTSRTKRQWLWIPVGGFIAAALIGAVMQSGWTAAGWSYTAGLTMTVLLVGICEELAFRGFLLVGARRIFAREWQAMLFSSALFGLFHLPNTLLGSPLAFELVHVVQTALIGIVFYVLRRLSGRLVLPIAIHAIWDLVVLQTQWNALSLLVG